MSYMKTAISIDEGLFQKAEKLSTKLNISRSQLFSQALEYLIGKSESLEIIKKLNEVYGTGELNRENDKLVKGMKGKMKDTVGKW